MQSTGLTKNALFGRVLPVLDQRTSSGDMKLVKILNTHHHHDHAGGNAEIVRFGLPLPCLASFFRRPRLLALTDSSASPAKDVSSANLGRSRLRACDAHACAQCGLLARSAYACCGAAHALSHAGQHLLACREHGKRRRQGRLHWRHALRRWLRSLFRGQCARNARGTEQHARKPRRESKSVRECSDLWPFCSAEWGSVQEMCVWSPLVDTDNGFLAIAWP